MITSLIGVYILFIIVFLVFSAAGIYHLNRYGYAGDMSKPAIIFYSIASLAVIFLSLFYVLSN